MMSDFVTFVAMCLTAVGGTLFLSANPTLPLAGTAEDPPELFIAEASVVAPSYVREGRLYVTATINGIDVDMMIDTGASHTILSRGDATRLGIEGENPVTVETLAGFTILREGLAKAITIKGVTVDDRAVLISESNGISLIGMDLLTDIGGTHLALRPR